MLTKMSVWFKSIPAAVWIKQITGVVLGGLGGYIYYLKIGCVSGTCPITSNPYLTILWGAVLGYLLTDMIRLKGGKSEGK